jgi:hypothetical protein
MQDKSKSAEVAVLHWLRHHFLSNGLDIEAETNYLRAKAEFQCLLEMPKSQRPLPQQPDQAIGASRPKRDVQ